MYIGYLKPYLQKFDLFTVSLNELELMIKKSEHVRN
jgi:hypothetical protein